MRAFYRSLALGDKILLTIFLVINVAWIAFGMWDILFNVLPWAFNGYMLGKRRAHKFWFDRLKTTSEHWVQFFAELEKERAEKEERIQ